MNGLPFCLCALALSCANGFAQTNRPPALRELFTLPKVRLQAMDCEISTPPPKLPSALSSPSPAPAPQARQAGLFEAPPAQQSAPATAGLSLSYDGADDAFEKLDMFRRLDRGGYLVKPGKPPDTFVARALNSTFRPELVHLGKTTMSCSLITAIKRKNPFCLLNPIFFQLSW